MHDALRARRNFRLLLGGQFISDLGGQLTIFALPAIAIVTLHAGALAVGALQAFEFAMIPLAAIAAGVVADRYPRRPLMIAANLVRLAALALIPISWSAHTLSIGLFFAVGAVCATASVVFDTAYTAFLPALVGADRYARAVGRLAMSGSAAEALGAGAGGSIVQTLGGPLAVLFNLATYVISTVVLLCVRRDDESAANDNAREERGAIDVAAGFRVVLQTPILRALAFTTATAYLGGGMVAAVFMLYCYRQLALDPVHFGIILGLANGGLIGAGFARRIADRIGARTTMAAATALGAVGKALYLVHAAPLAGIFAGRLLESFCGPVAQTTSQTLQSANIPESHRGRAAAAMRTLTWGALPVGSLLGGLVGSHAGISAAIAIGSAISLCSIIFVVIPSLTRGRVFLRNQQRFGRWFVKIAMTRANA